MPRKFLQASALISLLVAAIAAPAFAAGTEEDAAVPAGSFTSDMPVPVNPRFQAFLARHPEFARHMRERMMHRAELEQNRPANAR